MSVCLLGLLLPLLGAQAAGGWEGRGCRWGRAAGWVPSESAPEVLQHVFCVLLDALSRSGAQGPTPRSQLIPWAPPGGLLEIRSFRPAQPGWIRTCILTTCPGVQWESHFLKLFYPTNAWKSQSIREKKDPRGRSMLRPAVGGEELSSRPAQDATFPRMRSRAVLSL